MKFVNLTPNTLFIRRETGTVLELRPSGRVAKAPWVEDDARPAEDSRRDDEGLPPKWRPNGFRVVQRTPSAVLNGIPLPEEGVLYVVSDEVAQAYRRRDLLAPGPAMSGELCYRGFVSYYDF